MTKTMKIEGMKCVRCSGRVEKALTALDTVESACVSHETGTAVVTLKSEMTDAELKKVVEDLGYTVISCQ